MRFFHAPKVVVLLFVTCFLVVIVTRQLVLYTCSNVNNPDEIWLFDPLKQYYVGGSYSDNQAQLSQLGGEYQTCIFPEKYDAILFVRHTNAEQEDPGITKLAGV